MSDVTALLLTVGEETTPRALKSLTRQTLPPREIVVIRNVRPFYKALNTGAAKVRTPFFLQVDADMVLDSTCIKDLRNCVSDDVGVVVGQVRDPMVGRGSGIKLFRTKCFEDIPFRNTISPDTDFSAELLKYGWKTVFALKYADTSPAWWHTFCEHQPSYTLEYTFAKFLIQGGRHRYRNSVFGLRWHFRQLQTVNHPGSDVARIALGHGLFLTDEEVLPVSPTLAHDLDLLKDFTIGHDLDRLKDFMGKQDRSLSAKGDSFDEWTLTPRRLFQKAYKHAIALRKNGGYSKFIDDLNLLGNSKHPFAWVGILGLCRGVFVDTFHAHEVRRVYRMLEGLLRAYGSVNRSGERLQSIRSQPLRKLLAMMLGRAWGGASAMSLLFFYQAARTGKNHLINKFVRLIDACAGMIQAFQWLVIMPSLTRGYWLAVNHLGWWPIQWFSRKNRGKRNGPQRMAYLIWHFPKLSETFIQREVEALKRSGVHLEVFSESPKDHCHLDAQARALMTETHYLWPFNLRRLFRYTTSFFLRHPLRFMNLFLYVLFHEHSNQKTPRADLHVFGLAVYMAGILREKNVTHLHSPWAIKTAFVCLVAARFLQIPYTVQARAHDIHRKESLYGLSEKLDNAERVVTNTQYNKQVLQSLMKKRNWDKIQVIYNGLNPEQFKPEPKVPDISQGITFLSVARLIEQKGLDYLLKACKILDEQGYSLRCEIIGGTEEPLFMNYNIRLKILWHKLGLQHCVWFKGDLPFSEILPKYQQAHIFVLPSVITHDGNRDIIPNVLLEAMAMKLPVISTPITGIPEIVEDGVSGLLVPPRDALALAEAMIRLLEDGELRRRLGEHGRARVEDRFDIRKNVQQYRGVFDDVGV
ncbi:MAG: glycosyltransferase [Nitrospirae bacterium]|nr:glycosyltransferase [Nitrospirota bacterium]